MEKKKLVYLLSVILILILITICIFYIVNNAKTIVQEYNTSDIEILEDGISRNLIMKSIYKESKTKRAPLIVIMHDSSKREEGNKDIYYKGYEYLVDELAEQGFFTISITLESVYDNSILEEIQINRGIEIYNQTIKNLKEDKRFKNKIDFNKINIISHGISSEIANEIAKKGNIISLLHIAPQLTSVSYADVPTAIILPQYDGNVTELTGQRIFNDAYAKDNRSTSVLTAYLYKSNTTYFNRNAVEKELYDWGDVDNIGREKQEIFLEKYATDYFKNIISNKKDFSEIFNKDLIESYGIDFLPSVYIADNKKIIYPDKEEIEKAKIQNVTVSYISQSKNSDETKLFNHPGIPENLPLYSIIWKEANGLVKFDYSNSLLDLSKYNKLQVYMALDSTSDLMDPEEIVKLDLVIEDIKGRNIRINLNQDELIALKYQNGDQIQTKDNRIIWSTFTPLSTTTFSYNDYIDIDWSKVIRISLETKSNTGAIMIGGLTCYKE